MSEPQGEWRALYADEAIEIHMKEGWLDAELLDEYSGRNLALKSGEIIWANPPGRRRLAAVIAEVRARTQAPDPLGPTPYALEKIPLIAEAWHSMPRKSKRRAAELAGVSRDTLADWEDRGWLSWPPPRAG